MKKFKTIKLKQNLLLKQSYKNDDLAMIFTSGSIKPKGVNINNLNFISSLEGQMKNIFNKIRHNRLKIWWLQFFFRNNSKYLASMYIDEQEIVPAKKIRKIFSFRTYQKK